MKNNSDPEKKHCNVDREAEIKRAVVEPLYAKVSTISRLTGIYSWLDMLIL